MPFSSIFLAIMVNRKLFYYYYTIGWCKRSILYCIFWEWILVKIGVHIDTDVARLLQMHPQLHSLKIHVRDPHRMSMRTFLNIIKSNRAICKLNVHMDGHSSNANRSDIQQLVNDHPSLVEFESGAFKFTVAIPVYIKLIIFETYSDTFYSFLQWKSGILLFFKENTQTFQYEFNSIIN